MQNTITIQLRAYPVSIRDQRTGERREDVVVLDKRQLRAAQTVGQSSTELIHRMYNRQGFYVLDIGKPVKRAATVELTELYQRGE